MKKLIIKKTFLLLFLSLLLNLNSIANAKSVNLRFDPIFAIVGFISLHADIAVSESVTVGPEFIYWNLGLSGFDYNAIGGGVRTNFYLSDAFNKDGWYLGVSGQFLSLEVQQNLPLYGVVNDKVDLFKFVGLFGYQWAWETFNINLGAGYGFATVDSFQLTDSNGVVRSQTDENTGSGIGAEFTLGWFF